VIASPEMKPVKREMVSLAELRQGDTCIIAVERDTYLIVKVIDIKLAENLLVYTPAILRTVAATEFVAVDDTVYTCAFLPDKRFERIFLEGESED
jgi:hypothetical protein